LRSTGHDGGLAAEAPHRFEDRYVAELGKSSRSFRQ
jgi:hypothetical protein